MNTAMEAGADGVFLINHGMSADDLLEIHLKATGEFPACWIGINCLGLYPGEVFLRATSKVAGIWVDNAMVDERSEEQAEAEDISSTRLESGWQGLYFGGVAFKYQRPVEDIVRAARIAARYMDVVTTSGPGTGMPALQNKILAMKQALGDYPLAIASGITPDNVVDYLDIADCFLVATGISSNFTTLDPSLVKALIDTVRSFQIE
jgi:hypothetical protein